MKIPEHPNFEVDFPIRFAGADQQSGFEVGCDEAFGQPCDTVARTRPNPEGAGHRVFIDRAQPVGQALFGKQRLQELPNWRGIAERSRLTAIIAGLEAMRGWSGLDHLTRIAVPALVLWGDGDRTYEWSQVETLWRTIPGANLAVVPACAHAVHFERPRHFNALIADFLDES